jgi:hypothetical protein
LIIAPPGANEEPLCCTIVNNINNVIKPGLVKFYRCILNLSPDHGVMYIADYNTRSAAAFTKKKLHRLFCVLFDLPEFNDVA